MMANRIRTSKNRVPIDFKTLGLSALLIGAGACALPEARPGTMDAPETRDPSLDAPELFLLSARAAPSEAQKQATVVISAHGFQASTYEWVEFQRYAEARGVLFSNVLLGGHGRSTEAWVTSRWPEWGQPLLDEYQALSGLGYEKIHLFCSSTGCTLLQEHLARGRFDDLVPMRSLVMVAPFLVPEDKRLYNVPLFSPLIGGNLPSGQTEREEEIAYHNRPYTVFMELADVMLTTQALVEEGIAMPSGTRAFLFRAAQETTVDRQTAGLLQIGLQTEMTMELIEFESRHHLFTRRDGRKAAADMNEQDLEREVVPWETIDDENYAQTFSRFMEILDVDDARPG